MVILFWIFDNKIKFFIEIGVEVLWGEGVIFFIKEEKKNNLSLGIILLNLFNYDLINIIE